VLNPSRGEERRPFRSFVSIPYCGRKSEAVAATLRKHDIRVSFKPWNRIESKLVCTRQPDPSKIKNAVYKINCKNCHVSYVGETSRFVMTRVKEHRRDETKCMKDPTSELVAHVQDTGHTFDFDNVSVLARNKTKYHDRLFCESFEIRRQPNTVNAKESLKLPRIYSAVI
jgi:hypothetical protein